MLMHMIRYSSDIGDVTWTVCPASHVLKERSSWKSSNIGEKEPSVPTLLRSEKKRRRRLRGIGRIAVNLFLMRATSASCKCTKIHFI
jgi:hypothetical protein